MRRGGSPATSSTTWPGAARIYLSGPDAKEIARLFAAGPIDAEAPLQPSSSEYAETVALRRLPPGEAAAWRRKNRISLWIAGVLIAVAIGYGFYRGAQVINLRTFFRWTGVALIFIAAGLLSHAVHELVEIGIITFGTSPAFDISGVLPHEGVAQSTDNVRGVARREQVAGDLRHLVARTVAIEEREQVLGVGGPAGRSGDRPLRHVEEALEMHGRGRIEKAAQQRRDRRAAQGLVDGVGVGEHVVDGVPVALLVRGREVHETQRCGVGDRGGQVGDRHAAAHELGQVGEHARRLAVEHQRCHLGVVGPALDPGRR